MMVVATLSLLALQAGMPQGFDIPGPRPLGQLIHTIWTPKIGGAPKGIRALAQTRDGYIWVGSYYGLYRFDGVRFLQYKSLTGDSMPAGVINRLT
ncbi:MAG TPA: two-component regulator propeller domain-containing protein, partial [Gemmatimonadales bacterium]|nr:two-component regulator propeller domain-containing protein [Gemmatimonadales bacterium]